LLVILFAVAGILKTIIGWRVQSGWFTVCGIVDLLLVPLALVGLPETGTWVIGFLLGAELVFGGLTLIAAAPDVPRFDGSLSLPKTSSGGHNWLD
jgi:uncharacterized membrane protein HdeD (DUF308 family)